jgi:hypothetical protein
MRNDPGGIAAPVTVNAMGVIGVPTVPKTFELLTTNCVAPASACTAPNEAVVANTARSSAPMRDGAAYSAPADATRSAGVRSNSSNNQAIGNVSRRMRWVEFGCMVEKQQRRIETRRCY